MVVYSVEKHIIASRDVIREFTDGLFLSAKQAKEYVEETAEDIKDNPNYETVLFYVYEWRWTSMVVMNKDRKQILYYVVSNGNVRKDKDEVSHA